MFYVESLVFKACSNAFFWPLVPLPMSPCHGVLSLVIVVVSIFLWLKDSTILVINSTGAYFHHIVFPMLHILMGRLNPFFISCIRNKKISLTTLIDIIGGRRVIDESNITLCKGKLRSMITKPFPYFLRFRDRTFKAFNYILGKALPQISSKF